MSGKLQQKIVVIGDNSIMLEQDDTYDFANKTDITNSLKQYYTKTETETYVSDAISNIDVDIEDISSEEIQNLFM